MIGDSPSFSSLAAAWSAADGAGGGVNSVAGLPAARPSEPPRRILNPPGGMLTTSPSSVTVRNRRGRRSMSMTLQCTVKLAIEISGGWLASWVRWRMTESLSGNDDGRERIDAERFERDIAVEPLGEGFDDQAPQRLGARRCCGDDGEDDERRQDAERDPPDDFDGGHQYLGAPEGSGSPDLLRGRLLGDFQDILGRQNHAEHAERVAAAESSPTCWRGRHRPAAASAGR